jgi:RNA polymerase sigma factor (sigma-70 family)
MTQRATLHPLFAELVEHIAIASRTEEFGLESAMRAFEAKGEELVIAALSLADEESDEEQVVVEARKAIPEVEAFLEALAKAGVDVDAGVEAEIEATTAALLGSPSTEGEAPKNAEISYDRDAVPLEAEALWKRDALRHRILNRAEEAELTHRYALFARTAKSLKASAERTAKRLAAAQAALPEVEAALVALKTQKRAPAAKRLEAAKAAVKEAKALIRSLETETERIEVEIEEAERAARAAEATFLAHNFKLVAHMAYKKFQQTGKRGSLMDLIQQGNVGMLDAFRKFDPTRGFKFSTFATWYINQKISEWGYEQIGAIRVPTHRWRDARKIAKFRHEYYEAYGAEPSVDEVAEGLGKSVKNVAEVMRASELMRTGSLDKPVGEDDDSATIGDLVADPRSANPEREAVMGALGPVFEAAFARRLDARERRVLMLRFGMYDGEAHTLDWIGKRMKITRERVRQIEAKAFEKLRDDQEVRQMLGEDVIKAMIARSAAA